MSVSVRDPRFIGVVGPAVEPEQIATGCLFTEGPLWHPREHYLLWSDMPGDHLRRWSAREGVSTYRKPCNKSNGLTWDRQGRLLACEHASSQVTRTEPDGRITPLATHHEGKQLNSPNDIVCGADGGIYFTDPPYGRAEFYGVKREQELSFQGVYRVGDDPARPELLVDDFDRPNGLCFSLDGRRLFVNDTARRHIRVFDVRPDGALAGGTLWAETTGEGRGAPDGMKIDSAGNVYCCGPGASTSSTPMRPASASSTSPSTRPISPGATRTTGASTSPRPPRSIASACRCPGSRCSNDNGATLWIRTARRRPPKEACS